MLGQQFADAHGVASRGLQTVEFAAQGCEADVIAVVNIEVGDACVVGIEDGEYSGGIG